MATLPNDTTELVPVGGLSYTASGMPYTSDPNMTLEEFLAASAQGPTPASAASITMPNYLADARNAGLPEGLRYTPSTYNLNPNYDPNARFSLAPGSELMMSQQDIDNARILWQNQNQQYSPKSWMINTDPTGYGGTHINLQSGNPYVLRNNATGEIIAQGSDDATLEKIASLISSGSLGDKWQLFEPGQSSYGNLTAGMSPEDAAFAGNTGYGNSEYVEGKDGQPGYWLNPIGGAKPAPSTLGKIVGTALRAWGLPVAGAYLGPAIQAANAAGTAATPLGAALAGAATGAAGSAVSGGNILKGALLGGATSFGLNQLASAVGPGALSGGTSGGNNVPTSVDTSGVAPVVDVAPITVVGNVAAPSFTMPAGVFNQVPSSVNTSDLKNGALPTSVNTTGINPMEVALPTIDASAVDVGGALPSVEPNQIVVSGGATGAPPSFPVPTGALTTATGTTEKPLVEVVGQPSKTDTATPPLTVDNLFEGLSAPTTTAEKPLVEVVGQPTKTDTTTAPVTAGPLTTATTPADKPLVEVVGQPTKTDTTTAPVPTGALTTATTPADKPLVEVVGQPTKEPTTPGLYTPSIIETATLTGLSPQEVLDASNTKTEPPKSPLSDIVDYLQIAGILSGLIGGATAGGGSGGKLPFGIGSKNPIYSAPLPTPGQNGGFAVGGLGGNTGPGVGGISPPGGDYTRYGMGNAPMHVAPSNIPQYGGVNPPGFNTDTWEWLGPQTGVARNILDQLAVLPSSASPASAEEINNLEADKNYAMGGYAVGGPGDGRSDEIPAMLSDGEYVIDAETVALLGNGSNKAGAQALDKFRANIRKHKGRELARGDFSAKAKKPEAYLSGGRS